MKVLIVVLLFFGLGLAPLQANTEPIEHTSASTVVEAEVDFLFLIKKIEGAYHLAVFKTLLAPATIYVQNQKLHASLYLPVAGFALIDYANEVIASSYHSSLLWFLNNNALADHILMLTFVYLNYGNENNYRNFLLHCILIAKSGFLLAELIQLANPVPSDLTLHSSIHPDNSLFTLYSDFPAVARKVEAAYIANLGTQEIYSFQSIKIALRLAAVLPSFITDIHQEDRFSIWMAIEAGTTASQLIDPYIPRISNARVFTAKNSTLGIKINSPYGSY